MTESTTSGSADEDDSEPDAPAEKRWAAARVVVIRTAAVAWIIFMVIQLVPYGWWHDNPPVIRDAPWPDAESEQIARTSCYSCHSNETDWPIYSYVAPMSWLVRYDVERARDEFNFSDWDPDDAEDAIEMIEEGSMPLDRYVMIHRDARLSDSERDTLIAALETMSNDDSEDEDDRGDDDD
jgi:Haem-binding domain